MMHPPLDVTADLFGALDLKPIAAELLDLSRAAGDGKAARTLLKSPGLTVVAMALRAGASLLEHAAPGPLLVVPVQGEVRFGAAAHSGTADVRADIQDRRLLVMGPGVRHEVTAIEDAVFLLVIGARPPA